MLQTKEGSIIQINLHCWPCCSPLTSTDAVVVPSLRCPLTTNSSEGGGGLHRTAADFMISAACKHLQTTLSLFLLPLVIPLLLGLGRPVSLLLGLRARVTPEVLKPLGARRPEFAEVHGPHFSASLSLSCIPDEKRDFAEPSEHDLTPSSHAGHTSKAPSAAVNCPVPV